MSDEPYTFNEPGARRVVDATREVEAQVGKQRDNRPRGNEGIIWAEILSNDGSGVYTAIERMWNGSAWVAKTNGRSFDNAPVRKLEEASGNDNVPTGTIVRVWPSYVQGSKTYWHFSYTDGTSPHPFKVTLASNGTDIEIGADRATNAFEDRIWVYDPADGIYTEVFDVFGGSDLDTKDTLTPATGTNYVYYIVYQDSGGNWECRPKLSAAWPPTENKSVLIFRVAKVTKTAGVIVIGQETFSDPILWPQPIVPSFMPYYIDSGDGTGEVTILGGNVHCYRLWDAAVAPNSYDLSVNTKIWVEITNDAGNQTPTVNNALQNGAAFPDFYNEDPDQVWTIRIGEVTGGRYIPHVIGDIVLPSTLFAPALTSIAGSDENQAQLLGWNTTDAPADVGSGETLLKLYKSKFDILGGNIASAVDGAAATLAGASDTLDQDSVEDVDTSVDNLITFLKRNFSVVSLKGLVQAITDAPIASVGVGFDEIWAGLTAGNIVHLGGNITSESDPNHWKKLKIDNSGSALVLSVDGSPVSSIEWKKDRNGHTWQVNSTDLPGPATAWKYRLCTDESVFIYRSADGGAFIEIANSRCYERIGQVAYGGTLNSETITNTYASCVACTGTLIRHEWINCVGGASVAVYNDGDSERPTEDYAWRINGASWIRMEFANMTNKAATGNPTSIDPTWIGPSACSDLKIPAEDSFSGTPPDSQDTAAGDDLWDLRVQNEYATGTGSIVISGGSLVFSLAAEASNNYGIQNTFASEGVGTGDFELTVKLSSMSFGSPTNVSIFVLGAMIGSTRKGWIIYGYNFPDLGGYGCRGTYEGDTPQNNTSMGQVSTIYLRIDRSSGTMRGRFSTDGSSWTTLWTKASNSDDIDGFQLYHVHGSAETKASSGNAEYATLRDSADDAVEIVSWP